MEMQEINQQKAEAFAGRMIGTLNEGAIAIMTSIGHRTGLFDAMSDSPTRPARRSPARRTWTNATCASGSAR